MHEVPSRLPDDGLTNLTSRVDTTETETANNATLSTQNATDVTALTAAVDTLTTDSTSQGNSITALNNQATQLTNKDSEHDGALTALSSRVSVVEATALSITEAEMQLTELLGVTQNYSEIEEHQLVIDYCTLVLGR